MANIFSQISAKRPKSNIFDLSHDLKLSLEMANLVPTVCMEMVPGDKFQVSSEIMMRLAPLVAPVMHRVDVYMHYFFVPNRILWSNWENFITGNSEASPPVMNTMTPAQVGNKSLADYLGIPLIGTGGIAQGHRVSALPFAAYQKIWNEYYRDQNLQADIANSIQLTDGVQTSTRTAELTALKKRAWRKDYFTSALPWPQKGDDVLLPLQFNDVDVEYSGQSLYKNAVSGVGVSGDVMSTAGAQTIGANATRVETPAKAQTSDLKGETTINEFRRALKLQEWLEKNARGGTRYIESILSHFGVTSSDKRLQRPEFIGGMKEPVVISEVLQTSGTQAQPTPQGNMSGHGISVGGGKTVSYYAEEHGFFIGIMSVLPQAAYQQGLPRMFSRNDRFDYYWPSFAHLGEQEIKSKELYFEGGSAFIDANNETFGYTPRYAEYKFMPSRVAGDFKSSLNFWHMGRIFSNRPVLGGTFVTADPTKRVFAVTDPNVDSLYSHVFHRIKAKRRMPVFGTPSI